MSESQDYSDLSIRRLELHQVGPFKDLVLEFPRKREEDRDRAEVHIFVGENGTGKTTLLEAMTFFRIRFMSEVYGKSGRIDLLTQEVSYLFSKVYSEEERYPVQLKFANGWTTKMVRNELTINPKNFPFLEYLTNYYSFPGKPSPESVSHSFFYYSGDRLLKEVRQGTTPHRFENPLIVSMAQNKDISNEIPQWISKRTAQYNQAIVDGNAADAEKYLRQISDVAIAIGEVIGRQVSFRVDFINNLLFATLDGTQVPISSMASGHQAVLSFLLDLMYRLEYFPSGRFTRFTLFLDEIDIHLHPKAQRQILPVLRKLFPNAQIFITTHSPFVVGSVDGAWVYKFKLDKNGYSVLDGDPTQSEDGHSYRWWLSTLFDITEQFGIDVEHTLKEFYEERDRILKNGKPKDRSKLTQIGNKLLQNKSIELQQIVSYEMRQVDRILGTTK